MDGNDRFVLTGTERFPLPGAVEIGAVDAEKTIPVSFYIATDTRGLRAEADAMAAKPIVEREYYSRAALYAKYPPSPETIKAVVTFANDNNLEILLGEKFNSLVHLMVPLSRVGELFGVELKRYEAPDDYSYRGRTGTISLPKKYFLEPVRPKIVGVFGLD